MLVTSKLTQRAKNLFFKLGGKKTKEVSAVLVLATLEEIGGLGVNVLSGLESVAKNNTKVSVPDLLEQAFVEAYELKHSYVGTEHIALALLKLLGVKDYKQLQKKVVTSGTYPHNSKKTINQIKKTPILDAFGLNLNALVEEKRAGTLIDRPEAKDLVSVLLQQRRPNAILVGDEGVGRSSLVRILAKQVNEFDIPSALSSSLIIEFPFGPFLSSVLGREGIEGGLSALSDELQSLDNVILFIPDFSALLYPAAVGVMPSYLTALFKSYILYSGVQVIASVQQNTLQKLSSEEEDLLASFSVVKIKEPDEKTTKKILLERAKELEKYHFVTISQELIDEVYLLSDRYLRNKKFPQKAVELLDKACSLAVYEKTKLPQEFASYKKKKLLLGESLRKAISGSDLAEGVKIRNKIKLLDKKLSEVGKVGFSFALSKHYLGLALSKEIDVPIGKLSDREQAKFSNLFGILSKRIVGQDDAVKALSSSLLRSRLGMKRNNRPMGTFLFLGPTGVGKTELAKVLSEEVFGEQGLIKIDMSDFAEKHTVSRLVGAPPGYIGFTEGGELTEKIGRNPYSVVLFDEVEKAHPDVLNILLQVMEDGVLVDARGRSFDFSHSIVILTSNMGTELLEKGKMGFNVKTGASVPQLDPEKEKLLANLKTVLKPELLNRFDDIIVFNRLNKLHAALILDILLATSAQLLAEKGFILKIDKKAKMFLVREGFSEEYGARSLRRAVEHILMDDIAKKLIDLGVTGPAVIKVSYSKTLNIEIKK